VLTNLAVDTTIVARCRGPLGRAGMSTAVAAETPNPDLAEPKARALDYLGLPAADRAAIAAADWQRLPADWEPRYLDLVEIFTLENALGVIAARPRSQTWADYAALYGDQTADLRTRIDALWARYRATYIAGGVPAMAPMTRSFHPWPPPRPLPGSGAGPWG
jgi:hypothetical protein